MPEPGSRGRAWRRTMGRIAASPFGTWMAISVGNRVDPHLLRWTGGRVSIGLGLPICLLTTVGARSGVTRTTPLLYARDGDRMVLVASRGGDVRHPAWYHNLRAHPAATVTVRGRRGGYLAHVAEGSERDRLWALVVSVYAGYETYRRRAGDRVIPVVVLDPTLAGGSRS